MGVTKILLTQLAPAFFAGLNPAAAAFIFLAGDILISQVVNSAFAKKPVDSSLTADAFDRKRNYRTSVAPRTVVYGRTRIGGPVLFDHFDRDEEDWHLVIALASHEITAIREIYFNEERIGIRPDGTAEHPWVGTAWIHEHLGHPDQAADPRLVERFDFWTDDHRLREIAYLYSRWEFNPELIGNGIPTVTAELDGRKVFDPRTGSTTWSRNPALCLRDYLMSSRFGLGVTADEIDEAAFIAAANVCDEPIPLGAGGSEARYTCDGVLFANTPHETNIRSILSSMAGTLVYSGGKFRVHAGAWRAPSLDLGESDFRSPLRVTTRIPRAERFNAVKGVYISPEDDWEPTDFPARVDSGYVSEDDETLYRDLELPMTASPTTAQRIARIELERARQEISVEVAVSLVGLRVAAGDTLRLTSTENGWNAKAFEVAQWTLRPGADGHVVQLGLKETAPEVYEWNSGLELPTDPAPNTDLEDPRAISPPTAVAATGDSSTAEILDDGTVLPRILLTWAPPDQGFPAHYEVELRPETSPDWTRGPQPRHPASRTHLSGISDDVTYEVRIRAVNTFGAKSSWVSVVLAVDKDAEQYDIGPVGNLAVTVDQFRELGDGTNAPVLEVSWVPPVSGVGENLALLSRYDVQHRRLAGAGDWESGTAAAEATSQVIHGVERGVAYEVRVRAVNVRERVSQWRTAATSPVAGKTDPPSIVGPLTFGGWIGGPRVEWDPVPDDDLAHYEIRRDGTSWETAEAVATVDGTSYQFPVELVTKRGYRFRVKAVNRSGVESLDDAELEIFNARPNLANANLQLGEDGGTVTALFNPNTAASWHRLHASADPNFSASETNIVGEGPGKNQGGGRIEFTIPHDSAFWDAPIYCRLSGVDALSAQLGEPLEVTPVVPVTPRRTNADDVERGSPGGGEPLTGVVQWIGGDGRPLDSRFDRPSNAANVGSIQLSTGVLSSTWDGSAARIDVVSHVVQFDFGQRFYAGGAVAGLAGGELYYVWTVDPDFAGGTVTYFASQSRSDSLDRDYYFVGSIQTATSVSGPTQGGGGAAGGGFTQ